MRALVLLFSFAMTAWTLTPNQWFLKEISSDNLLLIKQENDFLKGNQPSPILWDELSFRYDIKRLDNKEHKLELRYNPAKPGSWSQTDKLQKNRESILNTRKENTIARLNKKKVELLLEWKVRTKRFYFIQKRISLIQKKITTLFTPNERGELSISQLLETRDQLLDARADSIESSQKINLTENKIRAYANTLPSESIDFKNFTFLNNQNLFKALTNKDTTQIHYQLELFKQKSHREKLQWQQEDKASSAWFDHFKVGYKVDIPNDKGKLHQTTQEEFIENWSIGMAFNIPFFNGKNQKVLEKQLNYLESRSDFELFKQNLLESQLKVKESFLSLNSKINLYKRSIQIRKEEGWESKLLKYDHSNSIVIDIELSKLKHQRKLNEFHFSLLKLFVEHLYLNGHFHSNSKFYQLVQAK